MLRLLDTFQNKNFETLEVTTVVLTGFSKNYPKHTPAFGEGTKSEAPIRQFDFYDKNKIF
jgi:hypothetical protein